MRFCLLYPFLSDMLCRSGNFREEHQGIQYDKRLDFDGVFIIVAFPHVTGNAQANQFGSPGQRQGTEEHLPKYSKNQG